VKSEASMSVTSDEINYLIYRYLQESGSFSFFFIYFTLLK